MSRNRGLGVPDDTQTGKRKKLQFFDKIISEADPQTEQPLEVENTTGMNATKVRRPSNRLILWIWTWIFWLRFSRYWGPNPAKEMFRTLQSKMEMLQLENKRLYQENIRLKNSKETTKPQPSPAHLITEKLNEPASTTTDEAANESKSESSLQREESQVKFLKSKLQVKTDTDQL